MCSSTNNLQAVYTSVKNSHSQMTGSETNDQKHFGLKNNPPSAVDCHPSTIQDEATLHAGTQVNLQLNTKPLHNTSVESNKNDWSDCRTK